MVFNYTKLFAWLIIAAGLLMIIWAVFSSYDFFTGRKDFPQVFKPAAEEPLKTSLQKESVVILPKNETEAQIFLQNQAQQMAMESIANLFPAETIFKFMNMASWIAFVSFLVFAGSRISGIGIKLLVGKA